MKVKHSEETFVFFDGFSAISK